MTVSIVNGYCTLLELKNYMTARTQSISTDATDDDVISDMITDASRLIDDICNRWFYSATAEYNYDIPDGREIWLDEDLLSVEAFTNGDGTEITTTDYILLPANRSPKHTIKLRNISSLVWTTDSSNNDEQVLTVGGTWGFVDRTATDPESARVIRNTRQACMDIVAMKYDQRFGVNAQGVAQVTSAGVVITPQGAIPRSAYEALKPYIRMV